MSNKLDTIRKDINSIDNEILSLITKRSELLEDVLDEKIKLAKNEKLKIFIPDRESQIIQRLIEDNTSKLDAKSIKTIFQSIINECRNFQINKNKGVNEIINISIQGIHGSFNEQAAIKYCKQKNLSDVKFEYAVSSEGVLNNLSKGKTNYGVVAINNSKAGLVTETIEALDKHHYHIIDIVKISVKHALLSLPNIDIDDIKYVYSHPQALKQCSEYLHNNYPNWEIRPWANTALAASDLSTGNIDKNSAVIAHESCAKIHNLQILDNEIQDTDDNETLFFILKSV